MLRLSSHGQDAPSQAASTQVSKSGLPVKVLLVRPARHALYGPVSVAVCSFETAYKKRLAQA